MVNMILKMSGVTALYVLLTVLLWRRMKEKNYSPAVVVGIGIIYGICSVLSTHFGVSYDNLLLLNVRDMGPLAAGLFFHPVSGLIAGLIGGIERYIAGTWWNIGSYTRIACSVSTCLAGLISMILSIFLFRRKKPEELNAFFIGAVMEVFHMYAVLITHRENMQMAYFVVKTCAAPMIFFTGIGMSVSSALLRINDGEWKNPFRRVPKGEIPVEERFQSYMFLTVAVIFSGSFLFSYFIESETAKQNAYNLLNRKAENVLDTYDEIQKSGVSPEKIYYMGDNEGTVDIISRDGVILDGNHRDFTLTESQIEAILSNPENSFFEISIYGSDFLGKTNAMGDDLILLTMLPLSEVYGDRNIHTMETVFSDLLLITGVYMVISILVQQIVVSDLDQVNLSLKKITGGNLDETVNVRSASEFVSLSDDINRTVDALKGYISAAEKRIEEELRFARVIQDSVLPRNFNHPGINYEIFASMDPAKEVGGDFYDFFPIGKNKLALVIADVSGKGIPAALFMMRSKTMIRSQAEEGKSPSEIFENVNRTLCEGNDAEMFVTVWIGILDLDTGWMECANAGHEYPMIMKKDGPFEMYRDKHCLALAAMPEIMPREYELRLKAGDMIFVYTDGIPEAINEEEEMYGTARMLETLNRVKDQTVEEILTAVKSDLRQFVGDACQFDDVTMLGLRFDGAQRKAVSIHIPADINNLDQVLGFVDQNLETVGCSAKVQMQIDVALEELFVNVSNYAYKPGVGDVKISFLFLEEENTAEIVMKDSGKPFDPLAKADPDVTLSAEERQIGGLGIFMAKKSLDSLQYRRENGKNVLTLRKRIK